MNLYNIPTNNDAADVGGVENETAEVVALEVASRFDCILGKREGSAVDWFLGVGRRLDLFLGLNEAVDIDFPSILVLTDTLADIVVSVNLRVGLANTLFDCLGEGFEQFRFCGFLKLRLRNIGEKCFAVVFASGFVADSEVDLILGNFPSSL